MFGGSVNVQQHTTSRTHRRRSNIRARLLTENNLLSKARQLIDSDTQSNNSKFIGSDTKSTNTLSVDSYSVVSMDSQEFSEHADNHNVELANIDILDIDTNSASRLETQVICTALV